MEHQHKAFKFDVKDATDEGRFSGKASVYGVIDSYNDIVMPGCFAEFLAKHGNRIKVLSQHDTSDVIGTAVLTDSPTALLAAGRLVLDLPSAREMHVRLKAGLIDGISIGYEVAPGGASFDADGVRRLHKLNLWEISLVTFPANPFSRVTDVKRRDGSTTLAASLDDLAATIRDAKHRIQATCTPDPALAALEVEFRKLNNAVKRYGPDDPDVLAFASHLQARLDDVKAERSVAALLASIQDLNRQLTR